MKTWWIMGMILMSAGITFFLRGIPFLVFQGERKMPAWLDALGQALPPAIMAVLVVYCLKDVGSAFVQTGVKKLLAVAVVALTYKWKHSTLLSIVLGTGCYMLLLHFL